MRKSALTPHLKNHTLEFCPRQYGSVPTLFSQQEAQDASASSAQASIEGVTNEEQQMGASVAASCNASAWWECKSQG